MTAVKLDEGLVSKDSVARLLDGALDAGEGLLRLTPTWVPRSFLHPGRRIKLFPGDLYAFGADRGGIDERWFSSTTEAANEGRVWHEGLELLSLRRQEVSAARCRCRSWQPAGRRKHLLEVQPLAGLLEVLRQHGTDPASHASIAEDATLVGQEGKPESYYFPPQYNNVDNNFCYTFMGLEPGTTKEDLRRCLGELEQGRQRHSRSVAEPIA